MKQSVLFIDIDGVLFGEYDGYYQLRPGVSSFLVWAGQHFHCEFLTCWPWPRVQTLLEALYIDRRSLKLGYRLWYNLKTDTINPEQEDFYILDDNLIPEEVAQLEVWGLSDRYLRANREGSAELLRIRQLLIERAGLENK